MLSHRMTIRTAVAALAILPLAPSLAKDDEAPPRPKQIDALYACQAVADASERLACFDREVGSMRKADESGEVLFADRAGVKKARQGLFGLGNIRLGIFGRSKNDPEEQELKEITATVSSIGTNRDGKLLVILEDGARWVQTEDARIRSRTEQSTTVTIERGSLGSYMMVFPNGTHMKVKRQF